MPLPNFLIIGASKSGTTALYHLLSRHADVFLPRLKEPFFFSHYKPSSQSIVTLEAYRRLFEQAGNAERIGEATAGYLYSEESPKLILDTLGPDVRLIAILRHPVDRAYSMYWHRRRDAEEPLSFRDAIAAEKERIEEGWQIGWHYLGMGHYRSQLERYYALFPCEQLLVLSFDDFRRDRAGILRVVTDFLDLTPFPAVPPIESENRSFTIHSPSLERFVRHAGTWTGGILSGKLKRAMKSGLRTLNRKGDAYQSLDPAYRLELTRGFREDILYLAEQVSPSFRVWADDSE